MKRARPLPVAAVVVALATAIAPGLWAAIPVGGAEAAAGSVSLSATVREGSVRLGDDIVIDLTILNPTREPLTLPSLRLADDAVTVGVTGNGVRPTTITRLFGEFADRGELASFLTKPTPPMVVPAGGRTTGTVRFAAVAPGRLEFVVHVAQGDNEPLTAEPLLVEVAARIGAQRLVARVETETAALTIELDGSAAFNSVAHIWALARSGFYAGLSFHRVLPGLLVQTGDPRGDGTGTAGWYMPSEAAEIRLARGIVALARGPHKDSASSQWFVTLTDGDRASERLPGAYTVIGKVIEGLEIADAIAESELDAATGRPRRPARIVRVRTSVR